VSFTQSVICQLQSIQSVILQIVPNYVISFLMIIHRIGDATEAIQGDCICLSTNRVFEFVSSHHTLLQLNKALRRMLMLL
jgi:hypothetical protein